MTRRTRANSKNQVDSAVEKTPLKRTKRQRRQTEKGKELTDVSNSRRQRTIERSGVKRKAPSSNINTISEKSPHRSLMSPNAYLGSSKKRLYENNATKVVGGRERNAKGTDTDKDSGTDGTENMNTDEEEDDSAKNKNSEKTTVLGDDERKSGSITKEKTLVNTEKKTDEDENKRKTASPTSSENEEEDDSDKKKDSGTDGTENTNTDEEEDDSAKNKNSDKTTVLGDDERKSGSITKEKTLVNTEKKTGEDKNKRRTASPTSSEKSLEKKSDNKENVQGGERDDTLDDKHIKQEDKTVDNKNKKKASSSTSSKKTRRGKLVLPELMNGIHMSVYTDIDQHMESNYLKISRTGKEITEATFPFSGTQICSEDYQIMSRNTTNSSNLDLYAGYAILDLTSQWTFFNHTQNDKSWCPLPAQLYQHLKNDPYRKGGNGMIEKTLKSIPNACDDLFSYNVLDFTVFGEKHFSCAFVLHAKKVADESYLYTDDDLHPCIIYGNSLPSSSTKVHEKERVAKVIRTFLNQYGAEHEINWKRKFNKVSLPVYEIIVPRQATGWCCGYQTRLIRHSFMKAMGEHKTITREHMMNLEEFSQENFSYNPTTDVLKLRRDILYLAQSLKKIRQYHNDKNTALDFSRTVIDHEIIVVDDKSDVEADEEGVAPFIRKKKATRQAKTSMAKQQTLQKQRKLAREQLRAKKDADQERLDNFVGKMNREEFGGKAEAIEEASEGIRRKAGEKAVNSKSYKDRTFRRGLFQLSSSTRTFQNMLPYVSEVANRTNPTVSAVTLIQDPIGRYPDRSGAQFEPIREKTLRVAIAPSREYFDKYIDDLIENRSSYIIIDHPDELDVEVMGERSMTLKELRRGKRLRLTSPFEMEENADALDIKDLLSASPNNNDRMENTSKTEVHSDLGF